MNKKNPSILLLVCITLLALISCKHSEPTIKSSTGIPDHPIFKPLPQDAPPQLKQLIDGGLGQAGVTTGYDPSYVSIAYPGGDVNSQTGVCSDVIVRSFRKAGIDLQKEVHEDMLHSWNDYPKKWGLERPDANIDHRRVLNLMTYFRHQGKSLPITNQSKDYLPGDVIAWDLGNGLDHIGMVTNIWSEAEKRCLIIHNIGAGARVEDVMFQWPITGHYRYFQ
jgi:uncharacterized protein YijF (DUF1287 family)